MRKVMIRRLKRVMGGGIEVMGGIEVLLMMIYMGLMFLPN